jgi:predicted transcriptional regulator
MAKRLSIEVSDDVAELLNRVAAQQHTTMTDIVRRALAVIKAAEKQKSLGREHFGFVKDPSKLDAELIGVMD